MSKQKLELSQQEAQVQQLSTLQVAIAKMVELPITELADRIRNEMVDNAALEEKDGDDFDEPEINAAGETDEDENTPAEEERADDGSDYEEADDFGNEADAMGDYFSADDVPDYLQQRAEAERDRTEVQISSSTSFYDELQSQISEHNLTSHEQVLLEYLIGSLDEDGFLRKDLDVLADELEIYHNVTTSREELESVLKVLQQFEPRGIGARTLQECLHIQLADPDRHSPYKKLALTIVDKHFNSFVKRRWDELARRLKLDQTTLEHVRHELTHLNPMPGSALSDSAMGHLPTVMPDFFVVVTPDGEAQVSLNNGDLPELRVSRAFRDSIRQYGKKRQGLSRQQHDAYIYARQKVDAAQAFLNLLSRRRQTLLAVMQCIVDLQRPFFDDDDEQLLRPMTLKEVAERIGVDISTVSRVTSNKYVQTTYGIYPLKFFFSTQFTSSEGEDVSARQVKIALRELIESEDKSHPLADEVMAAELKKRGFNVARRTVAKYRDMMGFPTARLRKE